MAKMILRPTRILLASGVLFAAVLAVAASAAASPEAGVSGDTDGGVVRHVDPGSPVWRSGIRAGDEVIELHTSNDPGGWQLVTTTGSSTASNHLQALRRYVPWSVAGLVVAALAALLAFRGHPAAAPVLPVALEVVTQPLLFAGNLPAVILAGVVVYLGGAAAVAVFAPWRPWLLAIVLLGSGLAVAWVVAVVAVPEAYDTLEWARLPVAAGFSSLGLVGVIDRDRLRAALRDGGGLGYVDVAYVATGIAVLAIGSAIARIDVEYLVVAAAIAIGVYPIWRRNAIAAFDRFVTARARRDAAILAIEEERGRLARDIHDAPLQDLSGVIRRLDAVPGAEREAEALREVAARLRDVATALRPPVLQDLGLVAAIEDLRDQLVVAHPGWEVVVAIDELTLGRRPPPDVELAALRVVQEAAANAVAHSRGRRLELRGVVGAAGVALTAADDGAGFGADQARDARRAGHFGLDSMRERAEAVGAEVDVDAGSDGVSVRFHWGRPA